MATPSTMLPLGTPVPPFALADVSSGKMVTLDDFVGKSALLVMFVCNHCPYVVHVMGELGRLGRDYLPRGVGVLAINANSEVSHPEDGPANMRALAEREGWAFPFVFDRTQSVARSFDAACTPDFFVFDRARTLVYRGQLDDSRPRNGVPVTGRDLRAALDAVLEGTPVAAEQRPSIGCNIKWNLG